MDFTLHPAFFLWTAVALTILLDAEFVREVFVLRGNIPWGSMRYSVVIVVAIGHIAVTAGLLFYFR